MDEPKPEPEIKKTPVEIPKKDDVVEIPVGKYLERMRNNPWSVSTVVLAIVLIAVLVFNFGGYSVTGTVVSPEVAGENALAFISSNPNLEGEVTLSSVEKTDNFYEVMLTYQGRDVPVYVTLNGEYLLTGAPVSLSDLETLDQQEEQPPQELPKSDLPKVEAFIMSHCPYGTQIEKGLIPVVELLGDKIDFELKFVNYAMHGEVEVLEQTNQYCIQKEQNDKFLPYLKCFLAEGDGETCLTETKIDKNKLETCVAAADTEFKITEMLEDKESWSGGRFPQFLIHQAENQEYGVQGSPTLVINGQVASSARDSASLLTAICSAFNEAPEECLKELDSTSPDPGFGFEATAGSASSGSCG